MYIILKKEKIKEMSVFDKLKIIENPINEQIDINEIIKLVNILSFNEFDINKILNNVCYSDRTILRNILTEKKNMYCIWTTARCRKHIEDVYCYLRPYDRTINNRYFDVLDIYKKDKEIFKELFNKRVIRINDIMLELKKKQININLSCEILSNIDINLNDVMNILQYYNECKLNKWNNEKNNIFNIMKKIMSIDEQLMYAIKIRNKLLFFDIIKYTTNKKTLLYIHNDRN